MVKLFNGKVWSSMLSLLLSACFLSSYAYANNNVLTKASVGKNKTKPIVVLDGAQSNQRICLYQGEAYSLGAILEIRDLVLVCQESNDFELNGTLKWVLLESSHTRNTDSE
ncbi:DUF1496 domain-containing protein [Vibrio astriarenae]